MSDRNFSLVVTSSNEDFVLVVKPFCHKCAKNKVMLLSSFDLSKNEAKDMYKLGLKVFNIVCECNK